MGLLLFPSLYFVQRGFCGSSGCAFDRSEGPIVYPAATQVLCHLGLDFGIGRVRVSVEQGRCGDDHTRCAKATLDGLFFDKGLLKRMQIVSRSEAL